MMINNHCLALRLALSIRQAAASSWCHSSDEELQCLLGSSFFIFSIFHEEPRYNMYLWSWISCWRQNPDICLLWQKNHFLYISILLIHPLYINVIFLFQMIAIHYTDIADGDTLLQEYKSFKLVMHKHRDTITKFILELLLTKYWALYPTLALLAEICMFVPASTADKLISLICFA